MFGSHIEYVDSHILSALMIVSHLLSIELEPSIYAVILSIDIANEYPTHEKFSVSDY